MNFVIFKVLQPAVNFAGHQATRGCSRCKKVFPDVAERKDYSAFGRSQWEPRNTEEKREEMLRINSCSTKGEKEHMETLYETKFTPLVKPPFYDMAIRMAIVDPMHFFIIIIYVLHNFTFTT